MTTSIRLTPQLEHLLSRLARKHKQSKSEVLRQALQSFAHEKENGQTAPTPYEAMKHLLGCAKGGPANLSAQTGKHFRSRIQNKHRQP